MSPRVVRHASKVGVATAMVVLLLQAGWPIPAAAAEADVVISQVYGGGGNSGATFTHDFVELFNRGSAAADLSATSVQYASATGTTWRATALAGSIGPGQYFLVQEAQGSGGTTPLPSPDVVDTIAMAAASGKVALVANEAALGCGASCASAPEVLDFVGYGSADDFEGSGPAPALDNLTSAIRTDGGCGDTDDNGADFAAAGPTPRNSMAPLVPCAGQPEPGPEPPACEDSTQPELEVEATPSILRPPNHRYVAVTVTLRASDDADPSPSVALVSVTSSEPDSGTGPGDRPDDIVIVDDTNLLLRAERARRGPGRVYTLTYAATDACGNEAIAGAEVLVPSRPGCRPTRPTPCRRGRHARD